MQDLIKRLRKGWRGFTRRIKRSAVRTVRIVRRLPRRGQLILLGATLGCVALVAGGIALACSAGAADASHTSDAGENTPLMLTAQGAPNDANLLSVDITPPPTPSPTPVPTPIPTPTPTPDPTLRRGTESDEVQRLQERLMSLGFLDIDETTRLYGPQTEAAVKLFQRQVNFTETLGLTIDEDGVAGLQTLTLVYDDDAPKYCVKFGMTGDDITDMQDQLKDLGYISVVTGYYGEKTVDAIKAFQDRNGLSVDGLAGTQTFSLLYSNDARESATKAKEARTKANIAKMIEVAKEQLGDPYVRGNRGPDSFDCSGLVYYCLNQAGSNRRRLNAAGYSQVSDWDKISDIDNLKRGDLICFYDDGFTKVGHIGIVINNSGEMIDASSSNGKVVRRSYLTSYWRRHFYCGRRPW